MKVYRIEYDRRVSETAQIPANLVKRIDSYDTVVTIVGQGDETLLAIPARDLTYCALVDVPGATPPPPEPTDDQLRAEE